MLLAATLNQVDRDGGYTHWTPDQFVKKVKYFSSQNHLSVPVYPCLDHGGPWLKDSQTLKQLSLAETMSELKQSLTSFLAAGYQLLHIDPTADRSLPKGASPSIHVIVDRTVELIQFAELERERMQLPPVSYEVGSEEVQGGLVDLDQFRIFLELLQHEMEQAGLREQWPCFIVAQVGTNLHTTSFNPEMARKLTNIVTPMGSLIRGHYSDWVENPQDYPKSGMGGANVGPEFTAVEVQALKELEDMEILLRQNEKGIPLSHFMQNLQQSVIASNRWKKWLLPDEMKRDFKDLTPLRRSWLIETGARYVWTDPTVQEAKKILFRNISGKIDDPQEWVVSKITDRISNYICFFNLEKSWNLLKDPEQQVT
jgi:tagatose-1,6-bisphosphate aldolase non-catalytic subunit AgaZ/GatZ